VEGKEKIEGSAKKTREDAVESKEKRKFAY